MTLSRVLLAACSAHSSKLALLLLSLATLLACPATLSAQTIRFGNGQRGGMSFMMTQRGGGGGDDRGERMRSFFSQMRSSNASPDDRRQQMQSFFSRMRGGERGTSSRGGSSRGGREGSDRGRRGGSSKEQSKPKPRVRVTVDLPEQYADQDLDKDGQLGLYEWKLAAIAQFRTLDANGDGFLTPRELSAGSSTEAVATAAPAAASADPTAASTTAAPSTTITVSAAAAPAASKKDAGLVRIAKYTFKALDKDKDGSLSAQEWSQSKRTRESFNKKKVKMKLPIDEAGFVAAFPSRR